MKQEKLLQILKSYRKLGLIVIPINETGKSFVKYKHIKKNQVKEIKEWLVKFPDCAWAVVTGENTNLTIVDCEGAIAASRFKREYQKHTGKKLSAPCVKTPHGYHYYIKFISDMRSGTLNPDDPKTARIEIKNNNSLCTLPPSYRKGKHYSWVTNIRDFRSGNKLKLPTVDPDFFNTFRTNSPKKKESTGLSAFKKGNRDNTIYRFIQDLHRQGYSKDLIKHFALATNKSMKPPMQEGVILEKIKNLGIESSADVVSMTSADVGKECSKKIKFIWREFFPRGQMSLITARGGSGKTCFAVQICKEILKKRSKTLIVWIYCDRPISDLKTKLDVAFEGEEKVPENIIMAKRGDSYLWNFKYQNQIDDLARYIQKLEKKHGRKVGAVFIDSLSSVTQGVKENTDEIAIPMRRLVSAICSNGKTACVIIHHDNKNDNTKAQNAFRGFTGIQDIPVCHLSMKDTDYDNIKEVYLVKMNLPNGRKGLILKTIKVGKEKIKITELSQSVQHDSQTAKSLASEFLVQLFVESTKWPQKEIELKAKIKDRRLTRDVLNKAKYKIGIQSIKDGKEWYWYCDFFKNKNNKIRRVVN